MSMSRQSRLERSNSLMVSSEGLGLGVISEEFVSPTASKGDTQEPENVSMKSVVAVRPDGCPVTCACQEDVGSDGGDGGITFTPAEVEAMLKEKEVKLRAEFETNVEAQLSLMKEKFDFVLQNEQIRAGFMLREAHRERQEKVQALQKQLECKNMAGLMYVLCSERRKCKLEKLKIIEDYTKYIHNLQDILSDGQRLILHLSRGYKTAARVDQEWRDKMKKVIKEFQEYVYHFAGGSPDTNQYIFDIPALLQTEASIEVDPEEEPCNCGDDEEPPALEPEKSWWEKLEGDDRPFAVFGDMSSFDPPQRRAVLKAVKGVKTAPLKWKEYVFHEMLVKSGCPNQDQIKDQYPERLPMEKWECATLQDQDSDHSRMSMCRRFTGASVDTGINNMAVVMGSMLRMITTSNVTQQPSQKANILAARDSMEIASTTRLREKTRDNLHESKCVSISIGSSAKSSTKCPQASRNDLYKKRVSNICDMGDEDERDSRKGLGSLPDSLTVIPGHVPDKDHKINYEKICPMEKCQRMQVDSFTRSLPSYMRASPFTHFRHTYDEYETCSKEQLEILRQRIASKHHSTHNDHEADPLDEWSLDVEGVGVQTSDMSITGLLPCTCRAPVPSPAPSTGRVYNVEDLIPMKEALDTIKQECFHNERVLFDRFKVIGQKESATLCQAPKDFKQIRMAEITKILKQHPSMLDMFQGNTKC